MWVRNRYKGPGGGLYTGPGGGMYTGPGGGAYTGPGGGLYPGPGGGLYTGPGGGLYTGPGGVGCILVPGVAFTKVLVVDYIPVPEVGSIKGLEAGFTLGQTAPHICLTGHRVNNSYNIYEIMDI